MKVIGNAIYQKVQGHLLGKMEIDMKENLKMAMKKEKEFFII